LTEDHPPPEMLDRFLAGMSSNNEARQVVGHLAGFCEICSPYVRGAATRRARPAEGPAGYDAAYATGIARAEAGLSAIRNEQLEAAALWARIEGTPEPMRLPLIAQDPRCHTWALASRFLDQAAEFHWQDSPCGLESCRLAVAIAERLPASVYPQGLTHDLHARALAALADALRLGSQLDAAKATLRQARTVLARGTGDGLERVSLLHVEAGLQLTLGNPPAARRLLRRAANICRLYGDRHREGHALQKLALAVGYEDPGRATGLAETALELLDPGREPRLDLATRHALAWFLNDCGLGWEALGVLEQSRALYSLCRDSQARLMLPWLEARICRTLGRLAEAERGFSGAWHRFHDAGLRQELTLVSLDLAETYLAQGKTRHAVRLLKSFQGILAAGRMHAEGIGAWLLLVEAAAGETLCAQQVLRQAASYYRRAWRRELPFRPPRGMP
jgi:tetratricopeptide (TPR) repeat protein